MQHFAAYHKFSEWGEYDKTLERISHYSQHPQSRLEATRGHRVWVIGGELVGKKTHYKLLSTYIVGDIELIEEGFSVIGDGIIFSPPVKLFYKEWLPLLLKEQGNFGFGLNEIRNPKVIDGLLMIADKRGNK